VPQLPYAVLEGANWQQLDLELVEVSLSRSRLQLGHLIGVLETAQDVQRLDDRQVGCHQGTLGDHLLRPQPIRSGINQRRNQDGCVNDLPPVHFTADRRHGGRG